MFVDSKGCCSCITGARGDPLLGARDYGPTVAVRAAAFVVSDPKAPVLISLFGFIVSFWAPDDFRQRL
eukprot:1877934-Pyramimonas_sp.AAC.1